MINQQNFDSIIQQLSTKKDKNGNLLNMNSVMISSENMTFEHYFKPSTEMVDLRSLSKPIIAMTLGIAINKGMKWRGQEINLDTKIYPFFQDQQIVKNSDNILLLSKVTIRHLLTHTIGYADGLLFSKDIKGMDTNALIGYLLNYPIKFEPGTQFVYSNAGPYLLSVLIKNELGKDLDEWVFEHLFVELDIKYYSWKKYGDYCAGATGLKLYHNDLHKIGQVLFNNGFFKGIQLVPAVWVEDMTKVQIDTPLMYDETRVFPKFGYGYFLYICSNGTYYVDGTDGQYLIVNPNNKILITTLGHQSDMRPITECLRSLS